MLDPSILRTGRSPVIAYRSVGCSITLAAGSAARAARSRASGFVLRRRGGTPNDECGVLVLVVILQTKRVDAPSKCFARAARSRASGFVP